MSRVTDGLVRFFGSWAAFAVVGVFALFVGAPLVAIFAPGLWKVGCLLMAFFGAIALVEADVRRR